MCDNFKCILKSFEGSIRKLHRTQEPVNSVRISFQCNQLTEETLHHIVCSEESGLRRGTASGAQGYSERRQSVLQVSKSGS